MPTNKSILSEKVQRKLDEGRVFRLMEMRAINDDEFVVEGYAATFNQPYELINWDDYIVREQIDPHAFDESDMADVIMQYDHEGRVFARISNKTLELAIDSHGLKVRAYLGGTDIGRQLYQEIKGGYTTKMSFAFRINEDKREVTENKEYNRVEVLRTITKIKKVYDVSAVSLPANDATEISARNDGEGVIAEVRQEIARAAAEINSRKQSIIAQIKFLGEI